MSLRTLGRRFFVLLFALQAFSAGADSSGAGASPHRYRPNRKRPASLDFVLRHVAPGGDDFASEKEAAEIAERLRELSTLLRERPDRARDAADLLLAPEFKGAPLVPADEQPAGTTRHLDVLRAKGLPHEPSLDKRSFAQQLSLFVSELQSVEVAEFLLTAIEVTHEGVPRARTTVRFDVAGARKGGGRAERLGNWDLGWRRGGDGSWWVVSWSVRSHVRSQTSRPLFSEVTDAAFARIPAFDAQLRHGNDAWLAVLDSALSPDTMGLHGMSVADIDGDGRDDIYVAQPAGLPNRLFRNRGDGTFEDASERSGLGVLDNTSHTLFADLDNDGDQDALLVVRAGLLLFSNDGQGRFALERDAFRFARPLRGSPTAAALADYDKDGLLDVYLCTYSYFIGASEDKAGPATPYHDARNGPPNVLFRNEGGRKFQDVTEAAGLHQNNDRFSLAAAWADYDADGWVDLLVVNDFGVKNLYRNEGGQGGQVRFKDVAAEAGVLDHGAGMSAAFLDYDNDGMLDIYTGNMWTSAGLRVTSHPAFLPQAPPAVRALFHRHARGNSLFRNRGGGRFEDVSLAARVEMGRWAWASDALDFDLDGNEDLYVVNGMFTRKSSLPELDSFFWRQVVAHSPLDFTPGTRFDDGWRAINRMLVADGAQASHERNVLLHNDGRGGFDEVSGSLGLDLEQDGRAFAATDFDQDGDPDLAVFSPRSAPQLRLFRNDFPQPNRTLAVRLLGTRSNRDAAGARVSIASERGQQTKVLLLGSGFLTQRSKELLFGLGDARRVQKLTVVWPSGTQQTFADLAADQRLFIEEGAERPRAEPIRRGAAAALGASAAAPPKPAVVPGAAGGPEAVAPPALPVAESWLFEPFPAPSFTLRDLNGQERSLSSLRGRPSLLLFWSTDSPASRAALRELTKAREALRRAGIALLAIAAVPASDEAKVREAAAGLQVPLAVSADAAATFSILNRFAFGRREDLLLPSAFLLDGDARVVKVYWERFDPARIASDAALLGDAGRLARATPFAGAFHTPPGTRNYFPYALDLAEQGFDAAALAAFELAAERDPGHITFYNLGTLYAKAGRPAEARAAFERALSLRSEYPEANNSLGALLAQRGEVAAGIARFQAALAARPDFADALNNLGYALVQMGKPEEALPLFERALAAQPEFPEALNNLGIYHGQRGDLERAERYFKQAVEQRPDYGEAANNLALVLAARGDAAGAVVLLQRLIERSPDFEMSYVTLSKIYLGSGRRREGVQVLEQLLLRNPKHPLALQILREIRGG
jgi:tetratricopeptide (TPR) repeat protein